MSLSFKTLSVCIALALSTLTACGGAATDPLSVQAEELNALATPVLTAVYPNNSSDFHPGTTITLWGQNFVPNASNVLVQQLGNTWYLAGSAWWWNGNDVQINATLPSNLGTFAFATVRVTGPNGESYMKYLWIIP
jgi:hypothetical protein